VQLESAAAEAFRVPSAAVVRSAGQAYVFIRVQNDSQDGFEIRPVGIGGHEGAGPADGLLITSGLYGNEQIAVSGVAALKAAWLGMGGGE